MNKKLVCSGNTAWGMYNFRGKVLEHFAKTWDVTVIVPHDDIFSKKIQDLGCEVIDIDIQSKGRNPLADIWLTIRYIQILRKIKPDLSITYTIKPNIYASIAASFLKIPFLPITTGLGYIFLHNNMTSKVAKSLYKFAFSKASKVWFLNKDDMRIFKDAKLIASEKVELLHGEGIDTDKLFTVPLNTSKRNLTFLLIGRMIADKGLYEYVDAARMVKSKYPDVEFQLLGPLWPGNPAAVSEEQLMKWHKEGVVQYLGATNNVSQYIEKVDCVVLPSKYREGVPFTLMEGASKGRPLIATDIPGCQDVIIDGVTGFLCEVKNVKSLSQAMIKMIELSPEERQNMGTAGRNYMVHEFDIKKIIKQYDEFADSVLN